MTANEPAFPGLDSLAYPSPVYNPGISVRLHVATVLAAAAYGATINNLRTLQPLTDAERRVLAQQAVYMADALLAAEGSAA